LPSCHGAPLGQVHWPFCLVCPPVQGGGGWQHLPSCQVSPLGQVQWPFCMVCPPVQGGGG
jgi:hypothetical protein